MSVPGQTALLVPYRVTDHLVVPALRMQWEARRRRPFVSRQGELAALHTHLAHVMASHGQVVGIVGAHDLGKSRLLYEFCHSLAAHPVTYSALHETVRVLCP